MTHSALAGNRGQFAGAEGSSPARQSLLNEQLLAVSFVLELERHYQAEYRPGFYERTLQVSSFRLNRALQLIFKSTSHKMIQLRRYQAALELISDPGLKINKVSTLLNFSDVCYFCKWFKRGSGVSPKRYRLSKSLQARWVPVHATAGD